MAEVEAAPVANGDHAAKKKVKVVAPDEKAFKQQTDDLTAKIDAIYAKLNAMSVKKEKDADGKPIPQPKTPYQEKREELMKKLQTARQAREAVFAKKVAVDEQLKGQNDKVKKRMDEANKLRADLRYRTPEEADEAIKRLEAELKMQSFSLAEEKRIVSEINALKKSKKQLQDYDTAKQAIETERNDATKLRDTQTALFKELNKCRDEETDIRKQLDALKAQQEKEHGTREERQATWAALTKELDALKAKRNEVRDKYTKERQEYFAATKEERDRQRAKAQEERKKRQEEIAKQREQRRKEQEEYEASIDPHEEDKIKCSNLVGYLEALLPHQAAAAAEPAKPAEPARLSENNPKNKMDGVVLLKRKTEEEQLSEMFSAFGKGKKAKKPAPAKESAPAAPSTKALTHALAIVEDFIAVGVKPPTNVSEIPAAVESLKGRREHFEKLTLDHREKAKERIAKRKAEEEAAAAAAAVAAERGEAHIVDGAEASAEKESADGDAAEAETPADDAPAEAEAEAAPEANGGDAPSEDAVADADNADNADE